MMIGRLWSRKDHVCLQPETLKLDVLQARPDIVNPKFWINKPTLTNKPKYPKPKTLNQRDTKAPGTLC